ncbi:hypothetical protein EUZ85_16245 [Hahella sp. KA22]|uniref:hypothetical protein n=1 Tax=Hahella sp. KA22 TaxID=1628392 RepID=UPI000FDCE86C|nr:hypothetical protein [Hahella sp. KA22]AZZ92188.1 hypothetical protein ENC22_13680 [Hahella sp. KA22]QAY55559.1 hypothetical protein EUZ85_16245 [Hahella sp. KA22]
MHDNSHRNHAVSPSSKTLFKATAIAMVVGAGLLVTTVLPAEYGIDPTGVGGYLGLTQLNAIAPQETTEPAEDPMISDAQLASLLNPVWKGDAPLRTDTLTITLAPNEGAEIKAKMQEGDRFMFKWEAQGPVNFDMHGERPNAGDEFTSYWVGRNKTNANGAFQAPFEGVHGWYWHNGGNQPVTVTVTTTGFYEKLYKL